MANLKVDRKKKSKNFSSAFLVLINYLFIKLFMYLLIFIVY